MFRSASGQFTVASLLKFTLRSVNRVLVDQSRATGARIPIQYRDSTTQETCNPRSDPLELSAPEAASQTEPSNKREGNRYQFELVWSVVFKSIMD
jgi:hypothetical protein